MQRVQSSAAQGEIGFVRLPKNYKLPSGAKKVAPTKLRSKSVLIVGHSETGHHHVVDAAKAEMYSLPDGLKSVLFFNETDKLTHLRPTDTHEDMQFPAGSKYLVQPLRQLDTARQRAVRMSD